MSSFASLQLLCLMPALLFVVCNAFPSHEGMCFLFVVIILFPRSRIFANLRLVKMKMWEMKEREFEDS